MDYNLINDLFTKINLLTNENNKLREENIYLKKNQRGSNCSKEGGKYELRVYNIVNKYKLDNMLFCTQLESELAGSSSGCDILCNYNGNKNIGIEIKKCNTPDWMQCVIKYCSINNIWIVPDKGKIAKECKDIFNELITNVSIFNNEKPPFIDNNITHDEWINIKNSTNKWNDNYYDIPDDIIKKLYSAKGCYYIQISDYGLYHLGNDICNFNVPEFNIESRLRVRTKIHSRKNKKGFCSISVTIACQPKKISTLQKSNYSLDNTDKLPNNLIQ